MIINVCVRDLEEMLKCVEPEYRWTADYMDGDLEIEFEECDGLRAQEWVYSRYNFDVRGDANEVVGCIYYDESVGYCFFCDDDNHEEQGFNSPEKAEDALWEYLGY